MQDEKGNLKLHEDEDKWKELCNSRWGFSSLPAEYTFGWKNYYLQNNLQDLITSLGEAPDFPRFYQTLDISADDLTSLELTLFSTKPLKSGFFWLTALLSRLPKLQSLKISRGAQGGLGTKGARCLAKGLKNNPSSILYALHSHRRLSRKGESCSNFLPYHCSSLDLSFSGITHDCCEVLAQGILDSKNLQNLSFAGNNISDSYVLPSSLPLSHHTHFSCAPPPLPGVLRP